MPQVTGLIHILHFRIGQSRNAVGAPVDDTAALVDEALFIQGHEHLPDGLGAALVHGESGPAPIAGSTQLLLLLHNAVAVLLLPVPDPIQELFPPKIVAGQALLPELLLHLDLGGDARMVHTGDPQGGVALHPLEANEGVLQGIVHGVAHMQLARHVGGWHNNRKRLGVGLFGGTEIAALLPHFVNFGLHLPGFIDLRQFFSCHIDTSFPK